MIWPIWYNLICYYATSPGDSDSSDVTETLLLEAQEQAKKNKLEDNEDEEELEGDDDKEGTFIWLNGT